MVPAWAINTTFVLGFLLGIVILLWTLIRPPVSDSGSGKISIGKWEFQFTGRAIFQLTMGAVFIAFPALLASAAQPAATTPPPREFQAVNRIPEPSYAGFTFIRDTSILNLREAEKGSLWQFLPFGKKKSHPATLTNVMSIRKTGASDTISFTYGTSGSLDVRCLTHECSLRRAIQPDEHAAGVLNETWELTATVKNIGIGSVFDVITEVTYWDAFSTPDKQWFATYPNAQDEAEAVAVLILFPRAKPFKDYSIWAYPHGSNQQQRFTGMSTTVPGPDDLSLYWEVPNAQGNKTLEIRWAYRP